MTEPAGERVEAPRTLDELIHSLNNCLSAIGSGCLLIEDALEAANPAEIRGWLAEMQDRVEKAAQLARTIPLFVTAARRG